MGCWLRAVGMGTNIMNTEEFTSKAAKIHGNKYNYDQVNYVNAITKVKIYCNNCKEYFYQRPNNHLYNYGCRNCKKENPNQSNIEKFIKNAVKVHGDKYNYEKSKYIGALNKIEIYCNKCGRYFWQTANVHLQGSGCSYCHTGKKYTKEIFIEKAIKIHGNKYDYSQIIYAQSEQKIDIYCKKCSKYFLQTPKSHIQGAGCPHCKGTKLQEEIHSFIILLLKAEYNNQTIIKPYELDIWIPTHSLAIESHGMFYHSETQKSKEYHYDKYLKCKEKQITLIQIYEPEWYNKPEQIKSYIKTKLNQSNAIQPNQCNIITLNKQQYNQFQTNNAIINYKPGNTILGLQYNNQLITTINIRNNILLSYTELLGYTIPGGLVRLLQYHNKPITYNNNLRYTIKEQLTGLTYIKTLKPDFNYFYRDKLYSKYYYPKYKFKNYNPELTPVENMASNNYYRLWDAGYDQWAWAP